jgi:hypothetical protein
MQLAVNRQFSRTQSAVTGGTVHTFSGMANDMSNDLSSIMSAGTAGSSAGNHFPDQNSHQRGRISGG